MRRFFGLISSIPLILWLIRNSLVTGYRISPDRVVGQKMFGSLVKDEAEGAVNSLGQNIHEGIKAFIPWMTGALMERANTANIIILFIVITLALAGMVWIARSKRSAAADLPIALWIYAMFYTVFLMVGLTFLSFYGGTPSRYLCSSYTHLAMLAVLLAFHLIRSAILPWVSKRWTTPHAKLLLLIILSIPIAAWLGQQGITFTKYAQQVHTQGPDETKGGRYRFARQEYWFPTPAKIEFYRKRKALEDAKIAGTLVE